MDDFWPTTAQMRLPWGGRGHFYFAFTWLGATCSRTVVFFYAALAAIVGIAAVIAEGV